MAGLTCAFIWFPRIIIFFPKHLFIYLAFPGLNCGMWELVPWPGIKPRTPELRAWSLCHWATREIPWELFFNGMLPVSSQPQAKHKHQPPNWVWVEVHILLLGLCSSSSGACSIRIPPEFARNAESWAHPRPAEAKPLGLKPGSACGFTPPGDCSPRLKR